MSKAGIIHEGHIYPGAVHGFNNDATPERYNKAAATDAYGRMINRFEKYVASNTWCSPDPSIPCGSLRVMRSATFLFLTLLFVASPLGAQAPADATVYAVTYAEVLPSASGAMAAAFRQYREASRKEEGYIRFELREQVGRPGLFTVVEAWRDQKASEAHAAAAHTRQYQDAIRPIRVAGYDQRPYRAFLVAPAREGSGQAVHVVSHVDIAGAAGQAEAPAILRKLAEASRAEPGCLRFDVLQGTTRMNHYTIIEVWQDQKSIDAHRAAAHMKEYRDVLQPITGSPLDERWYKGVE